MYVFGSGGVAPESLKNARDAARERNEDCRLETKAAVDEEQDTKQNIMRFIPGDLEEQFLTISILHQRNMKDMSSLVQSGGLRVKHEEI